MWKDGMQAQKTYRMAKPNKHPPNGQTYLPLGITMHKAVDQSTPIIHPLSPGGTICYNKVNM